MRKPKSGESQLSDWLVIIQMSDIMRENVRWIDTFVDDKIDSVYNPWWAADWKTNNDFMEPVVDWKND